MRPAPRATSRMALNPYGIRRRRSLARVDSWTTFTYRVPPTTFAWAKQLLGPIAGEHVGARWREVLLPRAYLAHEAAPEVADHHQAAWLG